MRSQKQIAAWLWKHWAQWPHGSHAGFARYCGLGSKSVRLDKKDNARRNLRSIAKGKGTVPHACCRRISRAIDEYERGELVYQESARLWVRQARPRAAPPSANARKG